MIKLSELVLTCMSLMYVVSGCIVIPRFTDDPHEVALEPLQSDEASVDWLIKTIGPPDFILYESAYIWIDSEYNYSVLHGSGGGPFGEKEYVLAVDFDSSGKVTHHQVYEDYTSHDYCFDNGICFAPQTLNVPMAPFNSDLSAKNFEPDQSACIVYLFRDMDVTLKSRKHYVHTSIAARLTDQIDDKVREINFSAASVPGGYSRWTLPAPAQVQIEVDSERPKFYSFDVDFKYDVKRPTKKITFDCRKNEVKYVRLFLSKFKAYADKLELVFAEQAQARILDLSLMLDLFQDVPAEKSSRGEP